MKKILVFSDSHGCTQAVDYIFEAAAEYDKVFFCGDGIEDVRYYMYAYPSKVEAVKGNCDSYFSDDPLQVITVCGDVTFMITHGHNYHVKFGLENLAAQAKKLGVDCVLFGHTHQYVDTVINGIRLINPASLRNCYGCLQYVALCIENKKITARQIKISQNS